MHFAFQHHTGYTNLREGSTEMLQLRGQHAQLANILSLCVSLFLTAAHHAAGAGHGLG